MPAPISQHLPEARVRVALTLDPALVADCLSRYVA
jgi:hypothetical protein